MNRYYAIQVRADGRYEIYVTTNGIDRVPLPAVFDSPRKAITYCEMRQADVSPLRSGQDDMLTSVEDTPALTPADTARVLAGRAVLGDPL